MTPIQLNDDAIDYPVYQVHLKRLEEINQLSFPTPYFTVLLCADFQASNDSGLSSAIDTLIKKGNLYFCAWGNACEKAHDWYDDAIVEYDIKNKLKYGVTTTWHDKETLASALWYLLYCAIVDEQHEDTCSTIVITVADEGWNQKITDYLEHCKEFNQLVLEEDQ
ncbi:MAG: hypothetical protein MK193_08260 [Lentisphaeria bacterium]|nr:hypothetical protein [Lentisphaeria bacterium]